MLVNFSTPKRLYRLLNTFIKNGYKSIKVHNKWDFEIQFKHDGIMDLIKKSSAKNKLYIIDSYRTPIERKISSFFQNLHLHVPDYKNKTSEELIDIFNNKYLNTLEEYHYINDIMKEYDVLPFDEFDFKKKYVVKKKGNLIFIKLLFSNIDKWEENLSEIFNKKLVIHSLNKSEYKDYKSIYDKFRQLYKTKKDYI